MNSYGRNFGFLQPPIHEHRRGRFKAGTVPILMGAPVVASDAEDPLDLRRTLALAAADAPRSVASTGIIISELVHRPYRGQDPILTRPSDIDLVPAGTQAQRIFGTEVSVQLINTVTASFEGQRDYPGRIMVAGLDDLEVGDFLGAGAGDDEDGYWKEVADGATAWLQVTGIRIPTATTVGIMGIVDAQMSF